MSGIGSKFKIYDSVFTDLFRDTGNQLRLYKELHPEDTDVTADDISDVTLRPILTDQLYNDLGFTVKDRTILLVEAQSTWCPNMSLRTMLYLADTFKQYVIRTEQNYYNSTTVHIPKPELYVIYTGAEKHTEHMMSMAETFWDGDDGFMDVKVRVVHTENPGEILTQYAAFCEIFRENRAKYGETQKAVEKTIEECIGKNILRDYLTRRRVEVTDIMRALFDEDVIREMHENSIRRESREEGRKEGREEGEESMAEMYEYLLNQDRMDDLRRATKDPAFRQQIYDEMAVRPVTHSSQD